jgi:hypothetical protein
MLSFILAFSAVFVMADDDSILVDGNGTMLPSERPGAILVDGNGAMLPTCVAKGMACCIGDICVTTSSCKQETMPNFLGCSDDCKPKIDCVNTPMCKNPGEVWEINPTTKDYTCCKGERIKKADVINSTICASRQDVGLCSECGNGNCESWENICNCKDDCNIASNNNSKPNIIEENTNIKTIESVNEIKPTPILYKAQCVVKPELYKEMLELERKLRDVNQEGKDVVELKAKIETLNKRIKEQKDACIGTTREMPPKAVAVGITCKISEELQKAMVDAKLQYTKAIELKNFEKAKEFREKLADLEKKSYEERKECINKNVPGLNIEKRSSCEIPKELFEKLEKNKYRLSELKSLNETAPKDLIQDTRELESKISLYKAKCNALNVSKNTNTKDIALYYQNQLSEVMIDDNMDNKIEKLRDLRKEIDETIKNMLEQKKSLKYSEMNGVADKIEFKAKHVSVGDSETNGTEVEVEVEVKDSTVKVKPTDLAVLLSQEGYNVTTNDITVDENGIYVGGILIKTLPKAVFENNKNLERNAERIIGMKLEKEGEKAVYKTEYEVKKKLFFVIPAKAKYELKIDAENGETLQEKKPWWNGMAKTVKENKEEITEPQNETEVLAQ